MEDSLNFQSVVDHFRNEWNRGEIPSLAHFLSNVSDDNPQARRRLLLELIAVDLENKWRQCYSEPATESGLHDTAIQEKRIGTGQLSSQPPLLEGYVSEWSELGGVDNIPTSLIVHEYRLRHMYGDHPDHSQYETRFASHGRTLTVSLSQVDDELHDESSLSTEKSSTQPGSRENMTLLPDSPGTVNPTFRSESGSQQSASSSNSEESLLLTEGSQSGSSPGLKRFGNYELLGEIARGAMGVVFKARQLNPKRIVAVKMILTGQLAGEDEVRRFHAEAENAGCLKHANIVTIYESGELDGQHYFSMDYIEGQSLADLIQEKPLKMEEAARFARIIAEAIQYAHTQGVLHRDLKPSNVLIDAEGQPHVTDFGIAKQVQDESHMTASGAAMGTPSYMPPEQAKGDLEALGPTCDVYSLGALLYHLVTGRPPFLARSAMETMMQVLHNEPASPRVLNPEVDHDLETICLKCLEKEPHRRYATAQDLADDLARYQRHEPIIARPISTTARFRKWCRRNPGVAFFSATTFLSLVAISVGATYGFVTQKELKDDAVLLKDQAVNAQRDAEMRKKEVETLNLSLESTILEKEKLFTREQEARKEADTQKEIAVGKTAEANRQKIEAEKQKKIAENQKQLAERRQQEAVEERKKAERSEAVAKAAKIKAQANLGKANQAVQEMLTEVAQEELKNIPHMTPVRKTLLNKAKVFYENLLKDNDPDDVTLQKDKAKLEYLIGTIHQMSGEYLEAEKAFQGSIEIAARLANSSQGTSQFLRYQLIELKSRRELADVYIYKGKLETAQEEINKALSIGKNLTNNSLDQNSEVEILYEFSGTFTILGILLDHKGSDSEALVYRKKSVELHRELVDRFPNHSNNFQHRQKLANSLDILGSQLFKAMKFEEAIQKYDEAIAIQQQLREKQPESSLYKEGFARTSLNRAMAYTQILDKQSSDLQKQSLAESASASRESIKVFQELSRDFPTFPHYRLQSAVAHMELGRALFFQENPELPQVEQAFKLAAEELKMLVEEDPSEHEYRRRYAYVLSYLATVYSVLGSRKDHDAEQHLLRAIKIQQGLIEKSSDPDPDDRFQLAIYHKDLGDFSRNRGNRTKESQAHLQKSKNILEQLVRDYPNKLDYKNELKKFSFSEGM